MNVKIVTIMEDEIIKLFNEEEKNYFKENCQKAFQNRNDLQVVFQIN